MKFSNTLALALLTSAAACTTGDESDVGEANHDESARTTLERDAESQQGSQSLEQRLLAASGDAGISLATLDIVQSMGLKLYKCPTKVRLTTMTDPGDPVPGLQPEVAFGGQNNYWDIKSSSTWAFSHDPGRDQWWMLTCSAEESLSWFGIETNGQARAKACVALNLPGWIGFVCEPQV
ncbi:MAG: hypothetical protein IPL79_00995 [Myxococcales bacterium]|nr:hypothetical protein [Myxococcales bacterium]